MPAPKFTPEWKVCMLLSPALLLWLLVVPLQASELTMGSDDNASQEVFHPDASSIEKKWGIRIQTIRLTGSNHFIDLRYRVVDPDKAAELLKRQNKAYLIHESTKAKLHVSQTKLGPIRQTTLKPAAMRVYFILFSNLGKAVKKGDKATLVIGDFRAEHLRVQ